MLDIIDDYITTTAHPLLPNYVFMWIVRARQSFGMIKIQ